MASAGRSERAARRTSTGAEADAEADAYEADIQGPGDAAAGDAAAAAAPRCGVCGLDHDDAECPNRPVPLPPGQRHAGQLLQRIPRSCGGLPPESNDNANKQPPTYEKVRAAMLPTHRRPCAILQLTFATTATPPALGEPVQSVRVEGAPAQLPVRPHPLISIQRFPPTSTSPYIPLHMCLAVGTRFLQLRSPTTGRLACPMHPAYGKLSDAEQRKETARQARDLENKEMDGTYVQRLEVVNNVAVKIRVPYSVGHLPCPYDGCPRSFKHPTQRIIHVRKVHTGETPFKCKIEGCGKAYANSGSLKSHMKTHNTLKLPCPQCGKECAAAHPVAPRVPRAAAPARSAAHVPRYRDAR